MNLLDGRIIGDPAFSQTVLDSLPQRIAATLSGPPLMPETVIAACDRLTRELDEETLLLGMRMLGIDEALGRYYIARARVMFSRDWLENRLRAELGADYGQKRRYRPYGGDGEVTEYLAPLGALLHVAAGNVDGLPAFSVLEGLLTGNINILKLPEGDQGVSIALLNELIRIEPLLKDYIYVFDYSSKDQRSLSKLIEAADAVTVWGGDAAVEALRRLVPPHIRLIEWGHKLSFAYITPEGADDEALLTLAQHICRTEQLLCSSCQGLFIDSDSMDEAYRLAERFLPLLERAAREIPRDDGPGLNAQLGLELYNEELESAYNNSRVLRGEKCSVIVYEDSELTLSLQFRNCWVKRLPRRELIEKLRPFHHHLQSAALLCAEQERQELTSLLCKSGLTRVADGDKLSDSYCGAAHDGEYPLRRYMKVFSVE